MTGDGFRDSAERLVVLAALVLLCAAAAQLSFAPSAQTRHDGPQSAGPADAGVLLDGPFCYHAMLRQNQLRNLRIHVVVFYQQDPLTG